MHTLPVLLVLVVLLLYSLFLLLQGVYLPLMGLSQCVLMLLLEQNLILHNFIVADML
mgnify:CR=1 FL=1